MTIEALVCVTRIEPSYKSLVFNTTVSASPTHSERVLGDTEISYYLPSRENGVNDMYLHLGFDASPCRVTRTRVSLTWAILRARHPLLAARIEMRDYNDVRFVYDHPKRAEHVLENAQRNLEFRSETKTELIDSYLNGERTLSNERLSYLIISSRSSFLESEIVDETGGSQTYDLLVAAAHFIGDGMALHTFANQFLCILGGTQSEEQLRTLLEAEFNRIYRGNEAEFHILPPSLEERLPTRPTCKFFKAASNVDFHISQRKTMGGHSFPRTPNKPRHTIVPTVSFDAARTKAILQKCKANGVSISSAIFAICNVAWARTQQTNWELPMMMYSALNARPYLKAEKKLNSSYWFICISYFNVILPSFLPKSGDISDTFWHRARSAKKQSTDAAKHPLLIPRLLHMSRERGDRARAWAKIDDNKAAGIISPPTPSPFPTLENGLVPESLVSSSKVSSNALLGLSLLGNLDGIYKHSEFPEIKLHTLTTGSRQRPGGMLLFTYTFVGKLWVSLGYDENGLDKEIVDKFWNNAIAAIDEFFV